VKQINWLVFITVIDNIITVNLWYCVSVNRVQFINWDSVSVVVQCLPTFHWSMLHVSEDVMSHWMQLLIFHVLRQRRRHSAAQLPVIFSSKQY